MVKKALLVIMAIALWAIPMGLSAAGGPKPLLLILVDRGAVHSAPDGADYARSLHAAASAIDPDRRYAFATMDAPMDIIGPATLMHGSFATVHREVEAVLSTPEFPEPGGQLEAFVEIHNFLGSQIGNAGSEVYFVSGGGSVENYGTLVYALTPALTRFERSGWPVHTVVLPGSTDAEKEFLSQVADSSGGRVFDLSEDGGIKAVADHVLKMSSSGVMEKLAEAQLASNQLLTAPLSIVPGTREATVTVFRDTGGGDLRIETPSGGELSRTDSNLSLIVESPHLVILRLFDPEPGRWQIETPGISGAVSVWQHVENQYSLELISGDPMPLDEITLLVAHVLDEDVHAVLDDVMIFANITGPEGISLVYELNDDGVSGDRRADDGYHSATVPPLSNVGNYDVTLLMSWPGYDYSITTSAGFSTQAFPALKYEPIEEADFLKGKRTKIATLFVHVDDQPYPVLKDEITAGTTWPTREAGQLEIVSQIEFEEGTSWLYDVYLTPNGYGQHRFVFWLQTDYAGQSFTHGTDSVVLAVDDPTVPEPVVPLASASDSDSSAIVASTPVEPEVVELDEFPIEAVAAAGALGAIVLLLILYVLTRTRPRGYLFNDRNELVVDFAKLSRNPIMAMLFKDKVGGDEIEVSGFEGVSFRFAGKKIEILLKRGGSSVRVNNQPLMDRATIDDRSWIGAQGRLYTFMVSHGQGPAYMEAGAD